MRAFPRLSRQQPTLLVAAGLLLLLLWLAAYQLPSHLTLLMGGDVAHQRRFDEDAFVRLINGSEPPDSAPCRDDPNTRCWWWQLLAPGEDPYRWTSGDTRVSVPGIGGGPYVAAILARGQPTPQATPSTWQVGDLALQVDLPPSQIRRYHFLIPNQPSGDLDLSLRTQPYASPGDPRELGFVIYALRVAQVGSEPRTPAWSQIAWLAFFLAATYAVPRILSVGRHPSLIFAVSLGLISALALALARPLITVFTPTLAAMAAAALLLAALGWLLTRRLGQRAAFVRQVWALTLLSLVLRVGGVLHPHALYSDSMFHANKLYKLSLGQVFQTAGLPSEAGGGEAPYPTGAYLLLLPGQLIPALPRLRLVQVGTAALDSLMLPLIALLLARAGMGWRAALLGAACYLLPIPALEALSIGELANIAGQSIAMAFVALLTLGALRTAARWGLVVLAGATLAVGLLAHSGVTLSLGAFTAAAWLLTLVRALRARRTQLTEPTPVDLARLSLIAGAALSLVLLIYYSAPVYVENILGRVHSSNEPTGGHSSIVTILAQTLTGILGLTPTGIHAMPPLLGGLAIAGLGMLWARRSVQPAAAGLRLGLAALWLSVLMTQTLLLVSEQGVRWPLFLTPALCLSAGPLLAALLNRGRAGRLAASAALAATLTYGLLIWVLQIRDYFHI